MPLQFSLKSKILMSVVGSGLLFVSIYLIYNQTYNCPQCKAKEIKNINMQNENNLPKTPSLTDFNSKISTVEELKAVLDKKTEDMVLLDVRTPQEYASGYIAQAINLDVNNPNFAEQIQKLDSNKTYIVYCRTGNRSLLASQQMQAIGLKTIYVEQGFSYWQQAGYPIETSN